MGTTRLSKVVPIGLKMAGRWWLMAAAVNVVAGRFPALPIAWWGEPWIGIVSHLKR